MTIEHRSRPTHNTAETQQNNNGTDSDLTLTPEEIALIQARRNNTNPPSVNRPSENCSGYWSRDNTNPNAASIPSRPVSRRVFLWGGLGLLGAGVGATIFGVNQRNQAPVPAPTPAEAPKPTETETPTLSPEEQEQLELAKLATKDKEDAEKFASLDIEDFQNLSIESRLKRVNYYYYKIANAEIPHEYFDQKLTQSITLGDKNPIFVSTGLSNGEDIMWFSMFAEQAIDTAGAKETDSGSANRDMTMASQLTGGVTFDMKSKYGKELIELKTGENDKKTGRIPEDQIPETKTYSKPKEMVIDGETYKYREITNEVGGKTYVDTMIAVPSMLTIQNPNTGKFETLEFVNWLRYDSKEIKNPR